MEETPSWQGKWEPDPPLSLLASCDSSLGRSGDSRVENRDWRGRTRRRGALTLVLYPRKPGTPCACHPPRLAQDWKHQARGRRRESALPGEGGRDPKQGHGCPGPTSSGGAGPGLLRGLDHPPGPPQVGHLESGSGTLQKAWSRKGVLGFWGRRSGRKKNGAQGDTSGLPRPTLRGPG